MTVHHCTPATTLDQNASNFYSFTVSQSGSIAAYLLA